MLPKSEVKAKLLSTRGRFFAVRFRKRTDGSTRRMVARTGVHIGVTGKGLPYDREEKDLLPVWDVQKGAWRSIPIDSVYSLVCGPIKAAGKD
jgi:hypothetical protein